MKAMIFAAGLGTRLLPLTASVPKALVQAEGRSMLEWNLRRLHASGITEIIVNIHHFAGTVRDFLASFRLPGLRVTISDETGALLDTGGGLKKAADFFTGGDPFILHNVDVLSDVDFGLLLDAHAKNDCAATLVVQKRDTSRYLLFNGQMQLCGWEHTGTGEIIRSGAHCVGPERYAYSGIQAADPRLFDYFPEKDAFSLTELCLRASETTGIGAYVHEGQWLDVGSHAALAKAGEILHSGAY